MKNKLTLIVLFIITQNITYSQKFGDSYSSVSNKLDNITKSIYNKSIECDFNVGGIEGVKIYGFDSKAKLVSIITRQYLNSDNGKTLFNSFHSKYYSMFGTPRINKNFENCDDGVNCHKIKSKWEKSTESIVLTYYTINDESLVQSHYIRKKGTY